MCFLVLEVQPCGTLQKRDMKATGRLRISTCTKPYLPGGLSTSMGACAVPPGPVSLIDTRVRDKGRRGLATKYEYATMATGLATQTRCTPHVSLRDTWLCKSACRASLRRNDFVDGIMTKSAKGVSNKRVASGTAMLNCVLLCLTIGLAMPCLFLSSCWDCVVWVHRSAVLASLQWSLHPLLDGSRSS